MINMIKKAYNDKKLPSKEEDENELNDSFIEEEEEKIVKEKNQIILQNSN